MHNGHIATAHASDPDRVRANTHALVNDRIDRQAEDRIRESAAAGADASSQLETLDREWDFERVVEAEAAVTGLAGLLLSVTVDRRFIAMTGVATGMMLVHALHGWYPLLPVLRRIGVRTQNEIDRERYAIKAARGDFQGVRTAESDHRAQAAWRAVNA